MFRRFLLAVPVLLVAATPCFAAGTTALEFLKLGIGARSAGMGDAFVSVANDASASRDGSAASAARQTLSGSSADAGIGLS